MDVVASNVELGVVASNIEFGVEFWCRIEMDVVASNVELGVAFIELCAAFVETGVF